MKASSERNSGQPGWSFACDRVQAFLTQTGGHLAPVSFKLGKQVVQPFAIAPWTEEKLPGTPTMLKILRGDFFCCPFGGNAMPYQGESHPPHGETANRDWRFVSRERVDGAVNLQASMQLQARPGRVVKRITLRDGHTAIYTEHVLSGFNGAMPIGTHPMLKFPDVPGAGYISTSHFTRGQVVPSAWEQPEAKGYSTLKPGALFSSLKRVPTKDGGTVDLSRFPMRRGYEELIELINDHESPFAWNAVSVPTAGYVFFVIKNPSVLRETILWFSNGGRHYPPWNGRHVNVLGVEDVTAFFHLGLAESAKRNQLNRAGAATAVALKPGKPLRVAHIMALAAIPRDFTEVTSIVRKQGGVELTSRKGHRVFAPLDLDFVLS